MNETLESLVASEIKPLGLELFEFKIGGSKGRPVLDVRVERVDEQEVTVDDCAAASRAIEAKLDAEDFGGKRYVLEVSSPGLDRPLRHAADYGRFSGRRAKLVMREAVDGQTFFRGRLAGLEEKAGADVLIDGDDGRRHRVPIGVITRANLEVDF